MAHRKGVDRVNPSYPWRTNLSVFLKASRKFHNSSNKSHEFLEFFDILLEFLPSNSFHESYRYFAQRIAGKFGLTLPQVHAFMHARKSHTNNIFLRGQDRFASQFSANHIQFRIAKLRFRIANCDAIPDKFIPAMSLKQSIWNVGYLHFSHPYMLVNCTHRRGVNMPTMYDT